MVSELKSQEESSHEEVLKVVISKLLSGIDLKYNQQRKKFVEALCSKEAELGRIVKLFVLSYTRLLKQYSKGKKFALFEQAWLLHIEDYFVETDSQTDQSQVKCDNYCSTWKLVVEKCDCVCSIAEQRIVVSTISYIMYDIVTEKVKNHKMDKVNEANEVEPDGHDCHHNKGTGQQFSESTVILYRYGGFALHSLLQKYEARHHEIVPVLHQLTIMPP